MQIVETNLDRAISQQISAARPAMFAPAPVREDVPTFGVESVMVKKKQHMVYKQLDGSYSTLTSCSCDRGADGALTCPIDTHRVPAVQRNPMWEWEKR